MGTDTDIGRPPVAKVSEDLFYYFLEGKRTFVGTLKQCVEAVIRGESKIISGGKWQMLVKGMEEFVIEPNAITMAREFVERYGKGRKPLLVYEWSPSRGDIFLLEPRL